MTTRGISPGEKMFIDWTGNPQDWFSEHDRTQDSGFDYEYDLQNQPVGFRVDGERYYAEGEGENYE